ncbi:unnamed protein product [Cyprideis torosa]|uniref:Uncharacterized protein n=1 Tax=Cyprideis torosa TaxID=163714 RepID=A0A7R8W4Y7_9CRUS|nr:unnamed protein product [Cyprideis torosa]CAG0884675.1 unnamed protein product [Cyprideis torosa]
MSKPSRMQTFKNTMRRISKKNKGDFDELRRHVKRGNEFGKELAMIMNERAELESLYAKSLSKLSSKLLKAARDGPSGTTSTAWQAVGADMEAQAELHRSFSLMI